MNGLSEKRKMEHIEICMSEKVEADVPPGFDDITLIHCCIPEISLKDINLEKEFLHRNLSAPMIIEPMTGGTKKAFKINLNLAQVANELGLAIGVGSQRAALEDKSLEGTFKVVRENVGEMPVLANIGVAQLKEGDPVEISKRVVEMIDADALTIHLNPLQESIQLEGETDFKGLQNILSKIIDEITVPVIVKETGSGISRESARRLEDSGVKMVDIAGLGGTSWAGVEYYRAKRAGDLKTTRLGKTFWNWGVPTVASLVEVLRSTNLRVVASGGVRGGLDVAKAIALGAEMVGLAHPLLKPASEGVEPLKRVLNDIIEELKVTMFLCSAIDTNSLANTPLVIGGATSNWLKARKVDISNYIRR